MYLMTCLKMLSWLVPFVLLVIVGAVSYAFYSGHWLIWLQLMIAGLLTALVQEALEQLTIVATETSANAFNGDITLEPSLLYAAE